MTRSMELGVAIIGAAGTLLAAVLALVPGLTADDRRRTRLLKDAELLKALPKGAAQNALEVLVVADTKTLVAEREKDRTFDRAMNVSLVLIIALWGSLVLRELVPATGSSWQELLRAPLIGVSAAAALLLIVIWVSLAGFGLFTAIMWLAKRKPVARWLTRRRIVVAFLERRERRQSRRP